MNGTAKRGRRRLATGFTPYRAESLGEFRVEVASRVAEQKAKLTETAIGLAKSGKGGMAALKAAADECTETEMLLETVELVMADLGIEKGDRDD